MYTTQQKGSWLGSSTQRAQAFAPFRPVSFRKATQRRVQTCAAHDASTRREAILAISTLVGASLTQGSIQKAKAEELVASASTATEFRELYDPILAYRFKYPAATLSGKPLSMVLARPPEKYSSAPPLSADARQRIVSEIGDFRNFVTVSMTVGPASGVLKDVAPTTWAPRDVAQTVLIDRSTARVSTGQRVALNDVEEAHMEERDGLQYWVYEHLSQGSPTIRTRNRETYRHALAVTSWRAGLDGSPYLYTLNMACPQELWEDVEPLFKAAVASFRLEQTTTDYIPPDKDPWRFF